MNTENKPAETKRPLPQGQKINHSRRAFARLGVTTPVLMSLGHRPAFGAICSVSGFVSATPTNVSAARHNEDSCGKGPVAWLENPNGQNLERKVNEVFNYATGGGRKLSNVLEDGGPEANLIAAYLNGMDLSVLGPAYYSGQTDAVNFLAQLY